VWYRSKNHLGAHIRDGNIFSSIHRDVTYKLEQLANDTTASICTKIEHLCNDIDNDLAAILTTDISLKDKFPAFFDDLGNVLLWAKAVATQLEGGGGGGMSE
jgi:hypothetical protein